jgi:membrane fusion protein
MSSTHLFRNEVMQARQAAWLGGIRVGHKPKFSAVAGVALLLAGCLVTFAVWGQVARKSRIPGVLMPLQGTVQLSANAAGVLTEQWVQEGEQVTAGQALFVLGTDRPTAEGSAAVLLAAHLAQRRSTLEAERTARVLQTRQRDTALQDRIRALDHEITQAQQEAVLASSRVALANKTLGRYQQMAQEGFVSDIQAQNKQEELIDLQARVENTQRNAAMGYQTLVGELGSGLSGGQKQRLLLARALYKQPTVLALDEATSHLDIGNEQAVNAVLAQMPLTRIVIAHRPQTIASAQRQYAMRPVGLTAVDSSETSFSHEAAHN